MNDEFCTIAQYIESKCTLSAKIAAYDKLISSMETAILNAADSAHLVQYEMDDSFMKIRAQYRSVSDMTKALSGLEMLRQRYINRLNGRVTVLRGGSL